MRFLGIVILIFKESFKEFCDLKCLIQSYGFSLLMSVGPTSIEFAISSLSGKDCSVNILKPDFQ